ncbi:MAG: hypothetical protein V1708_00740 [Candidatus Micrarchaeota archaeon]
MEKFLTRLRKNGHSILDVGEIEKKPETHAFQMTIRKNPAKEEDLSGNIGGFMARLGFQGVKTRVEPVENSRILTFFHPQPEPLEAIRARFLEHMAGEKGKA